MATVDEPCCGKFSIFWWETRYEIRVQFRDFAALRWEPCLFHSVLLHPSAAIISSNKGQNK